MLPKNIKELKEFVKQHTTVIVQSKDPTEIETHLTSPQQILRDGTISMNRDPVGKTILYEWKDVDKFWEMSDDKTGMLYRRSKTLEESGSMDKAFPVSEIYKLDVKEYADAYEPVLERTVDAKQPRSGGSCDVDLKNYQVMLYSCPLKDFCKITEIQVGDVFTQTVQEGAQAGLWCSDDPLWWWDVTGQGPCRLDIKVSSRSIDGQVGSSHQKETRGNAVFNWYRLNPAAKLKITGVHRNIPRFLFDPFIPLSNGSSIPERDIENVTIYECEAFVE